MAEYPRRCAGILLLVLAVFVVSDARAQPVMTQALRVNLVRELTFGYVAAGAPSTGVPRDTGVFEVLGPAGEDVEVVFALPSAMEAASGTSLPLQFDLASGAFSSAQSGADRLAFDPRMRQRFRIPPSGRFLLFIAPRTLAPRQQGAGQYRANVVVFVTPQP